MSEFTAAISRCSELGHEADETTAFGILAALLSWNGPHDKGVQALVQTMSEAEARAFEEKFSHLSGAFSTALWAPVQKRRRGGE